MTGISREQMLEDARKGLKAAHLERDRLLTHTVNSINELDKTANLFYERLSEWYGLYFPELKVAEPEKYCKIILMFDRKNLELRTLADIVGEEKAKEIISKAARSVGADFKADDLNEARALAEQIVNLYALRNRLEEYQQSIAKEVAPNLCYLIEPALAAKLIAQAGSLRRMAEMPASTVQLLGAEKALFKHLRSGTLPPKYGLIFQHPLIGNAPLSHRGKLARALATKLTTAAKADAFSHNFIARKLKEKFEARAKEISTLPQTRKTPPPGQQMRKPFRPDFRRREGGQQQRQFGQGGQQEGQRRHGFMPRWKRFRR